MNIYSISDTHNREWVNVFKAGVLPNSVLVHTGDATVNGTHKEWELFIYHLHEIKHLFTHILFVPGNHDDHWNHWSAHIEDEIDNFHVLKFNVIKINGITFSGIPYQCSIPMYYSKTETFRYTEDLKSMLQVNQLPQVDVLLTHVPPRGILDLEFFNNGKHPTTGNIKDTNIIPYHFGDVLYNTIIKPKKLWFVGHVHQYAGCTYTTNNLTYVNSALLDVNYVLTHNYMVTTI